jgi:hypothetical protein
MAKKSYAQRNLESIQKTGKSLYQRRVESGLNRGLTPQQARGHARGTSGMRPIPTGYVRNIRAKTGKRVLGQMIHTRQSATFRKQLEKMTDGTGVLIRVYGTDMSVTAKGHGKGGGINAGDLKQGIADRMNTGMSWEEAFEDTIVEYADGLYDDDSSEVDYIPQTITDFVAYTMY